MSKSTQDASSALPRQFQSATKWLAELRDRRIGAVELLQLHLKQIEKHNPRLNLVVAQDIEGALAAARQADNKKSDLPPLHGLPMTVKDSFEATGMPTTCGFPFLADHRPTHDADAVAQLKNAGAIVFGKTNLPTGAGDHQSFNPLFGTSRNPWDTSKCVGGSSGGSAAALASGMTPLELGSDIAGSIRVPAHFCGVYGHKPSFGIVSIRGHIPPLPGGDAFVDMGVAGPLARSAEDLELALDVLVGAGDSASKAWSVAIPQSRHERLDGFRVAAWIDDGYALDDGCRAQLHDYIDALREAGARVTIGARPEIDLSEAFETFFVTLNAVIAAMSPQDMMEAVHAKAKERAEAGDPYAAIIERSVQMSHSEFVGWSRQRVKLMAAWARFFESYDVLLCPANTTTAFDHDHSHAELGQLAATMRKISAGGSERPYADQFQWSSMAAAADLPATAIPTGRFVDGLPVGLQVIGPALEDRTPIRFAQLVEKQLGGFVRPSSI
ncbi:amidase [Bradyrhizobium betae]|uniref:Amidase domain-containing protein n=1 Tax=Bradyrhizobium betae TaxID=244734 RepID=A0A4Q1VS10_9BRAD|nr:amidase [Bradyrhizobium betae]RXT54220.1 hypothetical protein B5V03_01880 [Bradyrhizobium betae]